jgi:hypothetical protein
VQSCAESACIGSVPRWRCCQTGGRDNFCPEPQFDQFACFARQGAVPGWPPKPRGLHATCAPPVFVVADEVVGDQSSIANPGPFFGSIFREWHITFSLRRGCVLRECGRREGECKRQKRGRKSAKHGSIPIKSPPGPSTIEVNDSVFQSEVCRQGEFVPRLQRHLMCDLA